MVANNVSVFSQSRQIFLRFNKDERAQVAQDVSYHESKLFSVWLSRRGSTS